MPRKRRTETAVERGHGHCADVLMQDFGIPNEMRVEVCEKISEVWKQVTMIHSSIIWSVRGYQPHPATHGLERFLREHATHEQKNRKIEQRQRNDFEERINNHRGDVILRFS